MNKKNRWFTFQGLIVGSFNLINLFILIKINLNEGKGDTFKNNIYSYTFILNWTNVPIFYNHFFRYKNIFGLKRNNNQRPNWCPNKTESVIFN